MPTAIDPNVLAQLTADMTARKARHEARRAGLWAECLSLAQQIQPVCRVMETLERDDDEPQCLAPSVDVDPGKRIIWSSPGEDNKTLYPSSTASKMRDWRQRLLDWPSQLRKALDAQDPSL